MHEQWYDVFSTNRMIYFLAGLLVTAVWNYFHLKKRGISIDLLPLGIITGVSVIVFVAIQQVGLTDQVKDCNAQVTETLQERAQLSDQTDESTGALIEANSHWLQRIASPPPEIAALHTTDIAYQVWVRSTLKDYLYQVQQIQDKRLKALEQRREKTYPTPDCGLK